ncbi:MAG: epoxyqueuosine reductase QueH [Oscillospiraceae bacterium]|nr:epoxyqueuosine reductase QueH [Oscillospiraceae bacterium]
MDKPSLLLHSCCAPCCSAVLERLAANYGITVFYYNPNIFPEEEYRRRLSEQKRFLNEARYEIALTEGEYAPERFKSAVKGLESLPEGSERCFKCYEFRLRETAKTAKARDFEYFTTTLSVSPRKNAGKINEISAALAGELGIKSLYADFKKKDGYKRSAELSREYGLYRQKYCGCGL